MEWKKMFKSRILNRGYNYYMEGTVMEYHEDGDLITASVYGNACYDVAIRFNHKDVDDMECTCPYADRGENCKHMAAVLYEWEERHNIPSHDHSRAMIQKIATPVSFETVLENADHNQLKDFVRSLLDKHPEYISMFMSYFTDSQPDNSVEVYKDRFYTIVDTYGYNEYDYYGEDMGPIYDKVIDIIDYELSDFVKHKRYQEAFDISVFYWNETLSLDTTYYDTGDDLFTLWDTCIALWDDILTRCDEVTKEHIFDYFVNQMLFYYLKVKQIQNLFCDHFDNQEYHLKAYHAIKKAEEQKRHVASSYELNDFIPAYLRLLEQLDLSVYDLDELINVYNSREDVRYFYVRKLIALKRFDEAEPYILEGHGHKWLELKKEFYLKKGDKESCANVLKHLIVNDQTRCLSYYKELKALYIEDEWQTINKEIIDQVPDPKNKALLYREDQMYSLLLEYVRSCDCLSAADEFFPDLKAHYPKEILQLYLAYLNEKAKHPANRKTYMTWVKYLRKLKTVKGGPQEVQAVVNQWKSLYYKRSVMMEELSYL